MTSLPADIEVLEPISGAFRETHYRLPPRTHDAVKQIFLGTIGGAIVTAATPFVFAIFFAVMVPKDKFDFWLTAVLMPICFFGSFLFPLSAILFVSGAFYRWGRTEIICSPDRMSVRSRLGPFGWTSRIPSAELKGFRVQSGTLNVSSQVNAKQKNTKVQFSDVGVLFADYTNGKSKSICSGYTADWLAGLAQELSARLGVVDAAGKPLTVTKTSVDPSAIEQRTEQPTTSDARVLVQGDNLIIEHPPKGFWRGVPGFLKLFGIFWNGFMVLWTFTFMPALFAGQVKWNDGPQKTSVWFGLLFCTPFYLVGFGFLAYFYSASIYAARWTIRTDDLELWERGLYGEHTQTWLRSELSSIKVATRQNNDEDKSWTTFLQISKTEGNPTEHFSDRDKAELEWLATTLSKGLGLAELPRPGTPGRGLG